MGGARKSVLWVDDEIEFLRSHIMFLETRGYSVVPVFGGDEALQLIHDEPRRFDIVLLDEQMPGKDGLTTLEEIKDFLPDLPVVMVTKSEEEQVMEDALGKKIDGYLTKPVNPSQILSVCKAILDSPRLITGQVTQRFVRDYSANRSLLARDMSPTDWVRLYVNLASWDLELEKVDNEGLRQNHAGQKSDCNKAFSKYITAHYHRWLSGREKAPLMSPTVVSEQVVPLLKKGRKVRLVVLDSLRLDQYYVLESLLKRYFEAERRCFFSILPSAPRFARTALYSGKYPDELVEDYPQLYDEANATEQTAIDLDHALLKSNLATHGFDLDEMGKTVQISNAGDASDFLEQVGSVADTQLVTLSVDFFQMLTHGRSTSSILQEITADESSLRALTLSWFQFSPVLQALREFAEQGATVVLTTNHGAMLCNRGVELYGAKGLKRHLRYQFGERITSDERRCHYVSVLPQYRLPAATEDSVCLLGIQNHYFASPEDTDGRPAETQNTFCYGGISMEEMIAPLAVLEPSQA